MMKFKDNGFRDRDQEGSRMLSGRGYDGRPLSVAIW